MKKLIFCSFLLGFLLINTKFTDGEQSLVRVEPVKQEVKAKTIKKVSNVKVSKTKVRELTKEEEKEIQRIFKEDAVVMTAVLKHESGLNYKAQNWNCHYYKTVLNKEGKEERKRYSAACKTKADREKAWSVDCSLGQINFKGKNCPADLTTVKGSMKAIEKKYQEEGKEAWVSYKTGAYLPFMP